MSVPIIRSAAGIIKCILVMALVLLCPRYNPKILSLIYNIIIAFFGPLIMSLFEEGIHRALLGAHLYPTVVLFCTGSVSHFLLQTVLQLFYLHTIYQPRMLRTINIMDPEALMKSLTQALTACSLINIVMVLCFHANLRNAYNRIIETEKRKGEIENQKIFLLGFSHELRNLINSLMGNVRLAISENLNVKMQNYLRNADVCGELLLHLINNILDTGKVEIGELEVNPTANNIYKTMEKVWNVCSELIRGKNLQGKLMINRNVPQFLEFDSYRLTQMLVNLIGNAVKFTDVGSINITVEWKKDMSKVEETSFQPYPFDEDETSEGIFEKNQKISTFDSNVLNLTSSQFRYNPSSPESQLFEANRGILKISVTDTGHGILKENIPKLFQKFSQVSSDASKRKIGTGLGLFITKQLCGKMGGNIKVFSSLNKGTCFTFCLPLKSLPITANQQMIARISSRDHWQNSSRDLKAIIVDDDVFSQEVLQSFFKRLRIQISGTAQNGLEAFNKYVDHVRRGDGVPIVTMDLTMPIMSGKEGAEKIRQFEVDNEITPCIMIVISGNCSESEIEECTNKTGKIRANAFIKKPAQIEEISRIISTFFS